MRKALLVLSVVCFGLSVSAKSASTANVKTAAKKIAKVKKARLQDFFVDPTKDLGWMTEKEREGYIAYIYTLHQILEINLSAKMQMEYLAPTKKTSNYEFYQRLIVPLFFGEESHAVVPAIVVGGLALAGRIGASRAAPYIFQAPKFMGKAVEVSKSTALVVQSPATTAATTAATKGSSFWNKAWTAANVAGGGAFAYDMISGERTSTELAEQWKEADAKKAAAEAQAVSDATALDAETAAVEAARVKQVAETTRLQQVAETKKVTGAVDDRNREGMFCIFGGYGSRYKSVEGRTYCPSPAGVVNSDICKTSGFTPNFLCQSFGLSQNSAAYQETSQLCVELKGGRGLLDLSVRCGKAFREKFLPAVKAIDPAKLKEIQDQISAGIDQMEAERGIQDIGLRAYCEAQNEANRKRQVSECGAVIGMIDAFRESVPTVAKAADNAAAAPAARAPAEPATGAK